MTRQSRRKAAIDFLTLAASGKIGDAYERHVGPRFRHHNPHFRGDAASLKAAMEESAVKFPAKVLEVKRALQDDEHVVLLARVRLKPGDTGIALVHIFRFQGDRIVELWDISQAIPENAVNEYGMF
jgi:predicted SnoaL-like aldol condensation-catalyzing enzyme